MNNSSVAENFIDKPDRLRDMDGYIVSTTSMVSGIRVTRVRVRVSVRVSHLSPSQADLPQFCNSLFCAVEIRLVLHISSVVGKTVVFLHIFLLLSELQWLTSQNAGFVN